MVRRYRWLLPLMFMPIYAVSLIMIAGGHGFYLLFLISTFPWGLLMMWIGDPPGMQSTTIGVVGLLSAIQYALLGYRLDRYLSRQID